VAKVRGASIATRNIADYNDVRLHQQSPLFHRRNSLSLTVLAHAPTLGLGE